jgi:hypothetical protein
VTIGHVDVDVRGRISHVDLDVLAELTENTVELDVRARQSC